MPYLHHHAYSNKEDFLQQVNEDERIVVEEILCANNLLGHSVEFVIDRFVYHYEYGFRFTTNHGRFHLSFKLKYNGGIDYVVLTKAGTAGKIKRIASSLDKHTSIIEAIYEMKKYM